MTETKTAHELVNDAYELRALLHGAALLARTAAGENDKSRATACVALDVLLETLTQRADALGHGLDRLDMKEGGAPAG